MIDRSANRLYSYLKVRYTKTHKDWVLYIDTDEFVELGGNRLPQVVERRKSPVIYGTMIDRFSRDKKPLTLCHDDDIFVKFPVSEKFIKETLKGCIYKPTLMQNDVNSDLLSSCHDYSKISRKQYKDHKNNLTMWHFKWIESTQKKLFHRTQIFKEQGKVHWKESDVALLCALFINNRFKLVDS